MVPVAPVTSITADPFREVAPMCRGDRGGQELGGSGCGACKAVPIPGAGYGEGAVLLGCAPGFGAASRRTICHTVGVCSVVETTTVLPTVAWSPASASR